MNGRERILAALKHREPDRVPRDLGGTESSGMTALALHKLNSHLKINAPLQVFEPYQYVAYIQGELVSRFKIDTVNFTPEPAKWTERKHPGGFPVLLPEKWREETDSDGATVIRNRQGVVTARRPSGGFYFDPANPPLSSVSEACELDKYRDAIFSFDWPFFVDETLDQMKQRALQMRKSGSCVVFNLCSHLLAAGQLLRGYENFMVDLMINEDLAHKLLEGLVEGYARRIDQLAPALKGVVDVVLLNDDLGTQEGPMLSLELYQKMIKPYQKTLFSKTKNAFGAPLLLHSCGAVRDFIPDLIDVGVDALNPVQVSAKGMDLKELKKEFGSSITFWGGGVNTQKVLNRGTRDQVKDEVRRHVDIMSKNGGFVFCQVHNIQPDVPPENVVAMFEALDSIG